MSTDKPFKPALVVVDVQEDFCPPNGSLAVNDGRDVADPINSLLALPFPVRVATRDWHPASHISFASNHSPPDNEPFASSITIPNPLNPAETQTARLWPIHCVQDTPGAALIPELDTSRIQRVVEKGMDERVEAYSAFGPPFRDPSVGQSDLADTLRADGVTHAYVVGLAMDYCVKYTAVDAAKEGFETVVVREATKAVDSGAWESVEREMADAGVRMVGLDGAEVQRVRSLG